MTILDYREKTPRRVDPRALGSQFAEPGVVGRTECEYTDSAFGILVPRRLVSEHYRKGGRKASDIRLPGTNEQ